MGGDRGWVVALSGFDQSGMNGGGVINILHGCFLLKLAGKVL